MPLKSSLAVKPHTDVIDADGQSIGKVDHLDNGKIKLMKSSSPDGEHHHVPMSWVDHIDAHIHLHVTLKDIRNGTTGGKTGVAVDPETKPPLQ